MEASMNSIIRLVLVAALGVMLGGLAEAGSSNQQRVTGTCAVGSAIRVINADGTVVCEADDNSGGTVTKVGTGSGLTGGPITTSGTISVDAAQVQTRVTGSCSGGTSIRVINENGTVGCSAGGVTAVTASAPLQSTGGTTPNISLPGGIIDSGAVNTAIGFSALSSNTTGGSNTASGDSALLSNTTGDFNTATGVNALARNTTGAFNTASGYLALSGNTSGYKNPASGVNALASNTTGAVNTASGHYALAGNTSGSQNTASGSSALQFNGTGDKNTASGFQALFLNQTGSQNTASGYLALLNNTSGSSNTAIGAGADVSAGSQVNATAIGAGAIVNASNKIRLGNASVTVIEGQVDFTFTSDQTRKENFQPVDGEAVLNRLRGLNVTSWNYIGHDPKAFRHYGPMGQEFFAAFGHDGIGTIGSPTTLTSSDVAGILMSAVQAMEKRTVELRQTTEWLKETLEALKAENAQLRARLERPSASSVAALQQ